MKPIGERSIASFISVVLDTSWWLAVAAFVGLILLLVFSFCVNADARNLTLDLPVALDLSAPIHGTGSPFQTDGRIENLRGNLRFPVRNGTFFSLSMVLIASLSGCLLWGLNQLRHVFRSLSRGLVFIPENTRRIRWVGLTVIFGELARALLVYFWSYYLSLHFTAHGLQFGAAIDLSGTTLIAGLAILVIAEVFREGTRLHEEQSLTI